MSFSFRSVSQMLHLEPQRIKKFDLSYYILQNITIFVPLFAKLDYQNFQLYTVHDETWKTIIHFALNS